MICIYSVRQSLEDLKEIKVGRPRLIIFSRNAHLLPLSSEGNNIQWDDDDFFDAAATVLVGQGESRAFAVYIYIHIHIYLYVYVYIYIIHTCHLISPKPDWDQVHERPNGYIQSLEMEHLPSPFLSGLETHPMKYWLVHRYSHCLLQQFLLNQGV